MKNLTLETIAAVCDGCYHGSREAAGRCVTSITTDSRAAEPGCLFVPIVGNRTDGHRYIGQVMEAGALCTLSERDLLDAAYPWIRVTSSLRAVKDLAEFYLRQLDIPVVGITGSVGKTSTKEMIASVVSQKYRVLKTQGNFNNELGLPLTIFRLRDDDEIAILEMGISDFGEMSRLAQIARPDICVITNIGSCHLEKLGDLDGVLKAKTEIFAYRKRPGQIILNGDDEKLRTVHEVDGDKPVFFGIREEADVYADEIVSEGLEGISCRIHLKEESFCVRIPVPGRHMVYNALAGAAVGRALGLTAEEIRRGIESVETLGGRFHIIKNDNYTIIDDCYNANPASMKASLLVLQEATGRKTAILGDMGELGAGGSKLHREIGSFAAGCDIQLLVCAGTLSRYMAEAACEGNAAMKVVYFEDRDAMLQELPGLLEKGDTVLVKASRFMKFEKIVESLEKG